MIEEQAWKRTDCRACGNQSDSQYYEIALSASTFKRSNSVCEIAPASSMVFRSPIRSATVLLATGTVTEGF